jgi:hypothetical protein
MSTERDTARIVRSWLEEGRTTLPDWVRDDVLDRLPATPQRRSPWPARRFADMNGYVKVLAALAAVVAISVVGYALLIPGGQTGPGAQPTPSPSPSVVTSTASPQPVPPTTGLMPAGTYRFGESQFTRVPFTFTVPDGWRRDDGNFFTSGPGSVGDDVFGGGSDVSMAPWIVSHVYTDSCQWSGALTPVTSPADVVEALAAQTGHDTVAPAVTTLGGHPATRLELSVPAAFDVNACDSQFLRLWPDAGPNEQYGLPIEPGMTVTVYVVDLDGQAQLIAGIRTDRSSSADVSDLEQVIQSISFE